MKKIHLLIGTFLTTVALSHAVDSYSDVVGYQKTSLPSGYSGLGLSLVKPAVITGSVVSKSGYNVVLSVAAGTLDITKPYYLEVTSGPLAGERADVTVTSASTNVTIVPSSRNTSNLSSLAAGASVVVRPHVVLRDVDNAISPALVGNDDSNLCDRVLLFNNGFIVYNKASDNDFYQDGELDPVADTLVIAPGTGILVSRRSAGTATMTETGYVRKNSFARPYASGYQFIAPAYPQGISPEYLKADSSFGWTGADKILPFNNGFVAFVFDPSDTSGSANGTWYQDGELDPANGMVVIGSSGVGFIYKHAADSGVVEASPVAN